MPRQQTYHDARRTLQSIVEFAFAQGFHETGYDPIAAFEESIRSETTWAGQIDHQSGAIDPNERHEMGG